MPTINPEDHKDLDSIFGFLHWEEGTALLEWAATWPGEGIVVELGSLFGRSTAFLATGCRLRGGERDEVWAIDHFKGSGEHQADGEAPLKETNEGGSILKKFVTNLDEKGVLDRVQIITLPHLNAAGVITDPIRILFIDGEHDYESTKRNFEAWLPKVIPGGLILFHDDDRHHKGVQRVVSEIKLERLPNVRSIAAFKK